MHLKLKRPVVCGPPRSPFNYHTVTDAPHFPRKKLTLIFSFFSFAIDSVKTEGKESCGRVSFFGRDTKRIWGSDRKRRKKKFVRPSKNGRGVALLVLRCERKSKVAAQVDSTKKKYKSYTQLHKSRGSEKKTVKREGCQATAHLRGQVSTKGKVRPEGAGCGSGEFRWQQNGSSSPDFSLFNL